MTATPAEPVQAAPSEAAAASAPEAEAESEDNRAARQKALDHLTDTEGEQTVAEIIAGTGLSRNTCEEAIHRAVQSEQIERVAQGLYRLAPPKPFPRSRNGHTDDEWIARIVAWQVNPASWNVEEDGPPPNDPNHRIPLDVVGRLKDRQAREAKAAAKQAAGRRRVTRPVDRCLLWQLSLLWPKFLFLLGSPGRIRTSDQPVNSRLLYH